MTSTHQTVDGTLARLLAETKPNVIAQIERVVPYLGAADAAWALPAEISDFGPAWTMPNLAYPMSDENSKPPISHNHSAQTAFLRWSAVILLAVALFYTLPTPTALAAGPEVDTQLDENDHSCSDGDCSLRDAIETIPFWETRIITFAPTLAGQTITLTGGQLEIYTDLAISGTVPITISGNNASRVFYIGHTGAVAMSHLGIISGTAADGGGIYNDGGWMTISGSNIAGNYGGGIFNNSGRITISESIISGNSGYYTGGIESAGVIAISDSIISGNSGSHVGGISSNGEIAISDSIISDNLGEGLHGCCTMIVNNCIISDNSKRGIHTNGGIMTVQNSVISNNSSNGIYNDTAQLTVESSTISDNSTPYAGGGIFGGGTVINSTISGNSAGSIGGGISGGGTVINSTISGNSAGSIGGGISGGGTVINSTISGNSANEGGGIYSSYYSRLTITNSTISGNDATNNGGGIYSDSDDRNRGTITMTNVTVSDNSAGNGGGLFIAVDSTVYLRNSIIANSRGGGDCQNEGNIGVNSHNLIEDGSCNPALIGDPGLGALGNYGGKIWTHALLTGSPAIDAGDNSICPETDQRGVVRPYDGDDDDSAVCDLGAYEVAPFNVYLPVLLKP